MNHPAVFLLGAIAFSGFYAVVSSPLRYEPATTTGGLKELLSHVNSRKLLQYKGTKKDTNCIVCQAVVAPFLPIIRDTAEEFEYDVIFKLAKVVCTVLEIESKSVCFQVIPQYSEEIAYLINYGVITEDDICTVLLQETCGSPHRKKQLWNVTIPGGKPAPYSWKAPQQSAPRLRVLHVSDMHIDLKYSPGSLAECQDPQCCRDENGSGNGTQKAAGYWGDYRDCDTPLWTAESFFSWLSARQDTFDVIYWTGDLPSHHIWNQTIDEQLSVYDHLMALFRRYLPGKIVYPSLGNHEGVPADSFPPHYVEKSHRNQWLYDAIAEHWSTWLDAEAIETVRYAGFYSTLVKPGFRVISLNTMFGDSDNFWVMINETDPDGQLAWFTNELLKAERNGERVHVIGHMPTADVMDEYSRNLYRIVNRFEATIAGLFFGHTHVDHYQIFYERLESQEDISATTSSQSPSARPKAIAVGYIAPSLTPYNYLNPGYRVYDIDGLYPNSTFGVLGWTQYIMNLTDANLNNHTDFFEEYNTHDAYEMNTSFPVDMDHLTDQFWTNDTWFNLFYSHYQKMSPYAKPCDASCRQSLCCSLNSAQSNDSEYCTRLLKPARLASQELARRYDIDLRKGLDRARRSLRRKP